MTTQPLNSYIDHTQLAPAATAAQIDQLIGEAKRYNFASVCINPTWVKKAAAALKDSSVNVCTVIGFPLGATTTAAKVAEAQDALANGADEIDMVMTIGAAKSGDWAAVEADIAAVNAVKSDKVLKVIIEACLLTDNEKIKACQAAQGAGANFVKTSTGFSTGGATVHDVALMRQTVGADMGVKASGGIHTRAEAEAMIAAGATRLGCSAGVAIVTDGEAPHGDY